MHEQLRRIKHLQNEENSSRDHRADTAKRSRHQKPITPTPQSESMHNLGGSDIGPHPVSMPPGRHARRIESSAQVWNVLSGLTLCVRDPQWRLSNGGRWTSPRTRHAPVSGIPYEKCARPEHHERTSCVRLFGPSLEYICIYILLVNIQGSGVATIRRPLPQETRRRFSRKSFRRHMDERLTSHFSAPQRPRHELIVV